MSLKRFRAEDFRCLRCVELEFEPGFNVIYGDNASGKTSVLEAIGYLGRAKSFRGAPLADLIRHDAEVLTVSGRVDSLGRTITLGVRNSRQDGLEFRVEGVKGSSTAELAAALPLQIVDPDVHNLVAGGPEGRRRFLDWIAFHVEPGYLDGWRRFRRALRQRNAALKAGAADAEIDGWSAELAELAGVVDVGRRQALTAAVTRLEDTATALVGSRIRFEYHKGWTGERSLADALEAGIGRDRQLGGTQLGPHRAELKIVQEVRKARGVVSRGQQKLLASAMVLAATATVQDLLQRPLLLLLDDPAAELDAGSLQRLTTFVTDLGSQVVATSLKADELDFGADSAVFHVEHGGIGRVA